MSFSFSGSFLAKESGLPASTGTMTVARWVKRTLNDGVRSYLGTIRNAGESTGHLLFLNDTLSSVPYGLRVSANYGSHATADDTLAQNVWEYVVEVGSGANWSIKKWDTDTGAFVTGTVGQTAFAPALIRFAQDGYGGEPFTGLMAHIRIWSASLSDSQLAAEKNSATVVNTTGLAGDYPGDGGSISAAIAGRSGGALINGGSVTYSSDMPTFGAGFTGPVITGTADLPGEYAVPPIGGSATTRVNRLLWSGDVNNLVWGRSGHIVVGNSAPAPAGYGFSNRIQAQGTSGGFWQELPSLPPNQRATFAMAVRRYDTNFVILRHLTINNTDGAQGGFNMLTGIWDFKGTVGTPIDAPFFGVRDIGLGYWLIWITVTLGAGRVIGFFPTNSASNMSPVAGTHVDVAAFQYEEVGSGSNIATLHKPTTSNVVTRNLVSLNVSLAASSIAVGSSTLATVQALDNSGAPWDQFTGNSITSSDTSKATVSLTPLTTDFSGRFTAQVTGVAAGTTNIIALGGNITSAPAVLTVGGVQTGRQIDVRVEQGFGGSSNWYVGVYTKHAVNLFPSVKLFEATGQSFVTFAVPYGNVSRMLLQVPAGVSVTVGQQVVVTIKNDNINGVPHDGPSMFLATVI